MLPRKAPRKLHLVGPMTQECDVKCRYLIDSAMVFVTFAPFGRNAAGKLFAPALLFIEMYTTSGADLRVSRDLCFHKGCHNFLRELVHFDVLCFFMFCVHGITTLNHHVPG